MAPRPRNFDRFVERPQHRWSWSRKLIGRERGDAILRMSSPASAVGNRQRGVERRSIARIGPAIAATSSAASSTVELTVQAPSVDASGTTPGWLMSPAGLEPGKTAERRRNADEPPKWSHGGGCEARATATAEPLLEPLATRCTRVSWIPRRAHRLAAAPAAE
jgi:hypothetical protein